MKIGLLKQIGEFIRLLGSVLQDESMGTIYGVSPSKGISRDLGHNACVDTRTGLITRQKVLSKALDYEMLIIDDAGKHGNEAFHVLDLRVYKHMKWLQRLRAFYESAQEIPY